MNIYISGPIMGNASFEDDFDKLEKETLDLYPGSTVYNPVTLGVGLEARLKRKPTYAEYMKEDLVYLLLADLIRMMQGWEQSAGARCEHLIAVMCGLGIGYQ